MKKKIHQLGKRFIQHELIKGSSYLFIGTLIANILNFFFNLFVVRKLTSIEYGIYASLIALLTLLTIPSGSLITVIVKFATEYISKNEVSKSRELFYLLLKGMLIFLGSFLIVFILFLHPLEIFLHVSDTYLLIMVGILVCFAYVSVINTAYVQSVLQFGFLSFITLFGSIIKLAIGVIFLLLGFRLFGIFMAFIVAFSIPYILSFIPLKPILSVKNSYAKINVLGMMTFGLPAMLSIFAMSSLVSTDILLVKHFFNPHLAGIYGGLSLTGRAIMYFTGPIPAVMFPLLVRRSARGENVVPLFLLSLSVVLIPSLILSLGYFLFPSLVLTFFLGGKDYLLAAPYVGIFGLFIVFYSVLSVVANFLLSLHMTKIVFVFLGGAVMQIALIGLMHTTFNQVILSSLFVTLVMLVTLLIYYGKEYGYTKKIAPGFINNSGIQTS